MRIISTFKDYYDGIGGPNTKEDTPVYRREKSHFDFRQYRPGGYRIGIKSVGRLTEEAGVLGAALDMLIEAPRADQAVGILSSLTLNPVVVILCGKIHLFYVKNMLRTAENGTAFRDVPHLIAAIQDDTIWSRSDWYMYGSVQASKIKKSIASIAEKDAILGDIRWAGPKQYAFSQKGWDAFQAKYADTLNLGAAPHLFFEKAPILVLYNFVTDVGSYRVELNPALRAFDFAKIVDPFQCYQEIDMCLGSALAQQLDPVPERTPDLIRDAHGFDKDSFRNTKPDRRKRKQ